MSSLSCNNQHVTSQLANSVRGVIRQTPLLAGLIGEPEAADEPVAADDPACSAPKEDLKVTVFHDVALSDCPDDKEFQVQYLKYISAGSSESVTLSQMVPAGGKYEFICTDAQIESAKVASFRVAAQNHCDCSIDEGCQISQAFSQMPGDGSSLEVHFDLETGQITSTIVPPANAAAAAPSAPPSASRDELRPMPDPMFTVRKR